MAKMIPGGAPDQSAFFLSRQAAASEALVRLYVSLLAKHNEGREGEDFKREMFDKGADLQHELLDKRLDQGVDPNPYGPDGNRVRLGAEADARDAPAPAAPAAAPARQPQPSNAPLGTTPILPSGQFSEVQGTSGATDFSSRNVSDEARDAYAQAPPTATKGIRPAIRTERPTSALPGPGTGKKSRHAGFIEGLDPAIVNHFEQTEQKYGLPRHTLMTLFGLENDGGRNAQREGRVEGWFKFTDELAKEHGLNPNDRQDIYKMADVTAQNLIRNNMELKRINKGQGLSSDPADIPRWGILHQFGHTNGPLFLVAHQLNPNMPATAAMRQNKDPNVNYRTLVNNNLDPTASVDALVKRQAGYYVPWTNEAFKLAGDRPIATRPTATTKTGVPSTAVEQNVNEANTPPLMQRAPVKPKPQSAIPGGDAYAQAQGGEAGSEVPFGQKTPQVTPASASSASTPRPPANIPVLHNARALVGVNRRLVDAVRGGAEMALPPGYIVRAVSGREGRTDSRSYHSRGQAADFQIIKPNGEAIPHKGEDTTGLYTRLARGVKSWVQENDPSAERSIGYGGAFGTKIGGGGVPDLMHYDWGGSRGRMRPEVQFARLQPLQAHERNTEPRTRLAGPPPVKEAPQPKPLPKLPPGVVRAEYNKYEPDKLPHTPAEGYTPAGQLPPTHFGPQAANTATMDAFGNFKDTAAFGNKRVGITPPAVASVLGRSGGPELEMPMPPSRPITESGDLERGTPANTLPPDPNFADSADSTLTSALPRPSPIRREQPPVSTPIKVRDVPIRPDQVQPPAQPEVPLDIAPDEAKNVPTPEFLAPDERLNVPPVDTTNMAPDEAQNAPIDDGLNALDVPMPRMDPRKVVPDVPDIAYQDAASANATPGGPPAEDMLSSPPAPLPLPKPPAPRRLPWTAIKEDVPPTLQSIKDAIFGTPKAISDAGSHIAGNAAQLQKDVGSVAGSVADAASSAAATAGNVAGVVGEQAGRYNTMVDSRQQELERLGAFIKENYGKYRDAVQQNVPTIDANRGPSLNPQPDARYKGALPPQPNAVEDEDAPPVSAEELKKRISGAIFTEGGNNYKPETPDYAASIQKIKEWVARKMQPSPAQPAQPPTAPKPAQPAKPADPNVFVPPKMMKDGVTPWLPNTKPHHIPPAKKGAGDLLEITGDPVKQGAPAAPTNIPPAPGKKPIPNADVGFTIGPDGRFRPVLQPQQQAPVEEIQPAETE